MLKLLDLLPIAVLALSGGIARISERLLRGEKYNLKMVALELILAGFSGFLIHWLTADTVLPENYRTVAVALAGYSSRSVISLINAAFVRKIQE